MFGGQAALAEAAAAKRAEALAIANEKAEAKAREELAKRQKVSTEKSVRKKVSTEKKREETKKACVSALRIVFRRSRDGRETVARRFE